jgi:hypothetical protein
VSYLDFSGNSLIIDYQRAVLIIPRNYKFYQENKKCPKQEAKGRKRGELVRALSPPSI